MNQIFDSTDERYTIGQVRSVIVQRTFCPLHIYGTYSFLSVIHPLLIRQSPSADRSLSVTCPLHICYSCVLCAPYTFLNDPHRHRVDFHQRMNTGFTFFLLTFFAFFLSVRRLLPLSVNM